MEVNERTSFFYWPPPPPKSYKLPILTSFGYLFSTSAIISNIIECYFLEAAGPSTKVLSTTVALLGMTVSCFNFGEDVSDACARKTSSMANCMKVAIAISLLAIGMHIATRDMFYTAACFGLSAGVFLIREIVIIESGA